MPDETFLLPGHLGCIACGLSRTRTHVVTGRGALSARIVVCGEAPGADEDGSGAPFVGPSGQLLRGVLKNAGVGEDKLFFTNKIHCRPPGNRIELAEGSPCASIWLAGELLRLNKNGARVILATGKTAIRYFRPWMSGTVTQETFRDTRWPDPEIGPWWVVGAYHPSYALRQGGEGKEGNVAIVSIVASIMRAVAYASGAQE